MEQIRKNEESSTERTEPKFEVTDVKKKILIIGVDLFKLLVGTLCTCSSVCRYLFESYGIYFVVDENIPGSSSR